MKEEQKQPIQPPRGGKGFFSKKWTFPVLYMGTAALILASIMWYQSSSQNLSFGKTNLVPQLSKENAVDLAQNDAFHTSDALPVSQQAPTLVWPVATDAKANIVMKFYDENAADDVKAAALVQYEDSYWPHTGVDFATKDGTSFNVVAAGAGKVTRSEKDPMVGYVVEMEHAGGLTTIYQSLEDVKVTVGTELKQGDLIGKAGRNIFEKSGGTHLHFEVKENQKSVSPEKFFSQNKTEVGS